MTRNLTPNLKSAKGVVNITLPGHYQIYGGHYKSDDPAHSFIMEDTSGFDDNLYDEGKGNKLTLKTYIPLPALTPRQEKEFKMLSIAMDLKKVITSWRRDIVGFKKRKEREALREEFINLEEELTEESFMTEEEKTHRLLAVCHMLSGFSLDHGASSYQALETKLKIGCSRYDYRDKNKEEKKSLIESIREKMKGILPSGKKRTLGPAVQQTLETEKDDSLGANKTTDGGETSLEEANHTTDGGETLSKETNKSQGKDEDGR